MDAVTKAEPSPLRLRLSEESGDGCAFACMPPRAPLDMPAQSLSRFDRASRRENNGRHPWLGTSLARLFVFGGGMALTAYGAYEMYGVVDVGGVTPLEWALLILFVANFSWIALAFSSAVAGFFWLLFWAPKPSALPAALKERTAIVMPIYNEAPAQIFGALQAMFEDVKATGLGESFDWFFLSDTTDPDVFIAEERAFIALRQKLQLDGRIYYRHRPKNVNRKAGNIEDFVTRWAPAMRMWWCSMPTA